MRNIFNLDSPILRALATAFDYAVLNALTLLLCLPVVTAGAAVTALYRVILSRLDHSDESLSPMRLLREWVACLKRATLPWLCFLAAVVLLMADIRIIGYMPEAVRMFMIIGVVFIMNIVLLTGVAYFPLLAVTPDGRFRTLLSRALQCAIGLLPRMFLQGILWLVPVVLLIFFPKAFITLTPLWLCGWVSLCVLAGARLLAPCLRLPEEKADE